MWLNINGGGLGRYDGINFTIFTENSGLLDKDIRSVTEDKRGNIWITTANDGGICFFNGSTFTHFTEKEGLSSRKNNVVVADSKGNTWIGTADRGVSKFDGKYFTHYTTAEGLSDNCIWNIMEDSRGRMWFGTMNGGVSILNGDSFTYITRREGLSDNDVRSIIEDSEHRIWIGTRRGLNCLVSGPQDTLVGEIAYRPRIYTFLEQDGLNGLNFNSNYGLADSYNRLWWCTNRSVTMLDLNNFKFPIDPPYNLQLNRLDINGQFLDYTHLPDSLAGKIEFDSVSRFNNFPLGLKLPFRKNHLTFYFTALDWAAPHKIKYSYRMEGLDEEWSTPSSEPVADYRNLPYGSLSLQVRAIGAAQLWSDPFIYSFTIKRPWWVRWWAFVAYGLVLFLIVRYYINFIVSRERIKSDVQVKQVELEKMQELDHLKSRFFANISHEFRTPLTLILGPIEALRKKKDKDILMNRDDVNILHRNAKRLQQLINQILDISRLETGKVKLQVAEGDFTEYLRTIVLSFLSLAESKEIKYVYELPEQQGTTYFDRDKLEKIVTNLLSNAFKFTPAGGDVQVKLKYLKTVDQAESGSVEISISDSGKGIPRDQVERIFDRFYQVGSSDTREYEGTGIGLSLTREMITIYRGEIKVESELGKGSLFVVVIPVSREQFRQEEIVDLQPGEKQDLVNQHDQVYEEIEYSEEMNAVQSSENRPEQAVILIVEDNADLRKYISSNLKNECRIVEAVNGKKGLATAIDEIPDLIITDLMMPEMDGMELCSQVRMDKRTNHIPIIMLTAKADKESKLQGLSTGADDYLVKPFDADELLVRVRNLIRQRSNLRDKYMKEFALNDPLTKEVADLHEDFLNSVVDCIHAHIAEFDFGVDQLARELGFSRSQLYRKLNSLTGYGPGDFIRNIRLKQAARMLREGHTNITTVLYSVGFNSPSHFSKCFRAFFGKNPSDYLKDQADQAI